MRAPGHFLTARNRAQTCSLRKYNTRVFWPRANLKWHRYQPSPEVASVEEFLDIVQDDEYGCFFG
jgi:hypothetical protein